MKDSKYSSEKKSAKSKEAKIFKQYLEDFAVFPESMKEKEEKILLDKIKKETKGKEIIIENYSS